jgi:hypothetical protein
MVIHRDFTKKKWGCFYWIYPLAISVAILKLPRFFMKTSRMIKKRMGAQVYCHRILGKGAANLGRQDFLNAI